MAPVDLSNRRGSQPETDSGCSAASGEHKAVSQVLAAGQAAADQHGLMFIGFGGTKAVEVGKFASETDRRIGCRICRFGRKNFAHRAERDGVAAKVAGLSVSLCRRLHLRHTLSESLGRALHPNLRAD